MPAAKATAAIHSTATGKGDRLLVNPDTRVTLTATHLIYVEVACAHSTHTGVRGQLPGAGCRPHHTAQESNSGLQPWWQAALPLSRPASLIKSSVLLHKPNTGVSTAPTNADVILLLSGQLSAYKKGENQTKMIFPSLSQKRDSKA